MIKELATQIYSTYNTLTYNTSALSAIAPIYFDIAPDKADYPFTSYYILDSDINKLDTCYDGYDFMLQFSVFDQGTSPMQIMEIMDVIIDGYNEIPLTSLDGSLLNLEPKRSEVTEIPDDDGHQGIIEYRAFIQKLR